MEIKIKNYFVDNINRHLIALVGLAAIVFIGKPNFGQFILVLFGYFASDIIIRFIIMPLHKKGFFKQDKLGTALQDIVDKMNNNVTIEGDFTFDTNSSKKKKMPKKSKWQLRMEEMANSRHDAQSDVHDVIKGIKNELRDFPSDENEFGGEVHYDEEKHIESLIDEDPYNRIIKKYQNLTSNSNDIDMSGSSITVNGKTYKGSGNVSIINGVVKVNGKTVTDASESKNVNIILQGSVRDVTIDTTAKCYINGDVSGDVKAHNLECGNVGGNIKGHNITTRDVKGSVKGHNIKTR